MVIYIETLILDNFCLTYFISDLSYAFTSSKKSRKRMLVASFVSTLQSFLYLICFNIIWIAYLFKVIGWCVCSVILFAKKQRLITSAFVFLLVTMFIGGTITFILNNVMPYENDFKSPYGLIVVLGYLITFLVKSLHNFLYKSRVPSSLIYTVKTSINGVDFTLKGFLDTGNRLIDDKSSLPIVIVKVSSIIKGFSPSTFAELIEKGRENYISYTSVTGGVNKIMLIYPDYFTVVGNKENIGVAIGVSFTGFYSDYDVILHPLIINK